MLKQRPHGEARILTPNADALDCDNAERFREAMAAAIDGAGGNWVLDLTPVRFVDSSGLGAILSCLRRAKAAGGDLKLAGLDRPVRTMIELVRLDRVFEIHDSPESAAESFG